jgi:hypothetical protein
MTTDGLTDDGRQMMAKAHLWPGELNIYIPFTYAKFWTCTLPFIYFSRYKTAKSLKNGKIKKYILEISLFYNNSNYAGY